MNFNIEDHKKELEILLNAPEYRELEIQLSSNNARFSDLDKKVKLVAVYLLKLGQEEMLEDLWRLFYKWKTPNITEFLSAKYIGRTAEELFPKWRDALLDVFSPGSSVSEIVTSGAIGVGKSTCLQTAHFYNLYRVCSLQQPQATMGSGASKPLVMSFMTVTLGKASDAILEPFKNQLADSSIFTKIKKEIEFEDFKGGDKIPYCDFGDKIKFPNGIIVNIGSKLLHAISHDIFSASMDEANVRIGGVEEALETYDELKKRQASRFLSSRFRLLTLASSAGTADSMITRYTRYIKKDDPSIRFYSYALWDVRQFDAYNKGHFYVLRGTKTHPSKILDEEDKINIENETFVLPSNCITIRVPEIHRKDFQSNTDKALRDLAGEPTYGDDKPFDDLTELEDFNLVPEVNVVAPLGDVVRIIDKVPKDLFISTPDGKRFRRYPAALRYGHLDLAEVTEAGLCIGHKEVAPDGNTMYVADIVMWITSPTRIDFNAVKQFLIDIVLECQVSLHTISADQFQSVSIRQELEVKRIAKKVSYLSVDRSILPYLSLSSIIASKYVKVGKCEKLKGQLSDLSIHDNKIYTQSRKDMSDVLCGFVENARLNSTDIPMYEYARFNTLKPEYNKLVISKLEEL